MTKSLVSLKPQEKFPEKFLKNIFYFLFSILSNNSTLSHLPSFILTTSFFKGK